MCSVCVLETERAPLWFWKIFSLCSLDRCVDWHWNVQLVEHLGACRSTALAMKNGDSYVKIMADMAPAMPTTVRQSFVGSAKHVLLGTILNVLLICVPLALLSKHFQVGNVGHLDSVFPLNPHTENCIVSAFCFLLLPLLSDPNFLSCRASIECKQPDFRHSSTLCLTF